MNISNIKKNLAYYILGINLILFFIFGLIEAPLLVQYINISIVLFVQFIVIPINEYRKVDILKNKSVISILTIRIGLIVVFNVCLYKIFLSNNYNLKYTYWVCFGTFSLIILVLLIEKLVNSYRERKLNEKKYNNLYILGNLLITIFIISILVYELILFRMRPSRNIFIDSVKVPEYISIHKYYANGSGKNSVNLNTNIKIKSPEDLKKITMGLNSIMIKNIISTDFLNYERMRSDNSPYYMMSFHYENSNNQENRLENGYIDRIIITSNKNIAIEQLNKDDFHLDRKYYYDIFPINFSEETINVIFTYLN
ncbi:hypothetical protein [Tissierella sp.]|uniref:hypothetical protein n=1 Tax=Tissierella sp. TaxID=41274 RepID=UPI0028B0EB29|nr:hypothetical protein [Tissierella sp.]